MKDKNKLIKYIYALCIRCIQNDRIYSEEFLEKNRNKIKNYIDNCLTPIFLNAMRRGDFDEKIIPIFRSSNNIIPLNDNEHVFYYSSINEFIRRLEMDGIIPRRRPLDPWEQAVKALRGALYIEFVCVFICLFALIYQIFRAFFN